MRSIEQAIIIAAGHGISLGPLTKDRPKAMLPILGKPLIIRLMDRIREAGISRFVVIVDEHEGAIAAHLNTSWVPDANLQILVHPSPRGLLDALALAAPYINGAFILATYNNLIPPDHISNLIRQFEILDGEMVLSLTAASPDRNSPLPVVSVDGQYIKNISEGPRKSRRDMAAFPIFACARGVLGLQKSLQTLPVSERPDLGAVALVQRLLANNGRVGHVTAEWHMQLNRELDLLTVNKRILREGRDTHTLSELPGSVQIVPPVRIDPLVSVGRGARLGPNVYLESGAYVGQDAVIWDSVLLRGAAIANGEVVHGQIVARSNRLWEEPPTADNFPELP